MFLHLVNADGKRLDVHLANRPALTFGRSQEADVCIPDTKVSRIHAEIKSWDGEFVIKDLKSRNGTYVNGTRVDIAVLKLGDVIRIGGVDIRCGKEHEKGTQTIVREMTQEIEEGNKGYRTILREIVQSTEAKPKKP